MEIQEGDVPTSLAATQALQNVFSVLQNSKKNNIAQKLIFS